MANELRFTWNAVVYATSESVILPQAADGGSAMTVDVLNVPGSTDYRIVLVLVPWGPLADEVSALTPGVLSTNASASVSLDAIGTFTFKVQTSPVGAGTWTDVTETATENEVVRTIQYRRHATVEDQYGLARIPDNGRRANLNATGSNGLGLTFYWDRNVSKLRAAIAAAGGGGSGPITNTVNDGGSNVADVYTAVHTHTGTAGAGIGAATLYRAEDASGATEDAGRVGALLWDATNGSEDSRVFIQARAAGAALADVASFWGTGRVGVGTGTTAPGGRLELKGASGVTELVLNRDEASPAVYDLVDFQRNGSSFAKIGLNATDEFILRAGGVTVLTLTSGLNTFHNSLQVNGTVTVQQMLADNADSRFIGNSSTGRFATMYSNTLDLQHNTALTATVDDVATLSHRTSGTAAAGYGVGILMIGEDAGGAAEDMGRFAAVWVNAGNGTEESKITLQARSAGAALAEIVSFSGVSGIAYTTYSAATATTVDVQTLAHRTSGTAAVGFGTGILFTGEDAADGAENMGRVAAVWTNAGNGTEASRLAFQARTGGAALADVFTAWGTGRLGIGTGTTEPAGGLEVNSASGTICAVLKSATLGYEETAKLIREASGVGGTGDGSYLGYWAKDSAGAVVFQGTVGVKWADATAGATKGEFAVTLAGSSGDPFKFGVTAGLDLKVDDTATATVSYLATLRHRTSGTAAVGFGGGIKFTGEDATDNAEDMGALTAAWTNATSSVEASRVSLLARTAGAAIAEVFTAWGSGDCGIGTGSAAPVARLETIRDSVGSSTTPAIDTVGGIRVANTAAAGAGAQQFSPILSLGGRGWDSTAGSSKRVDAGFQLHPVQVAGNPTGELRYLYSVNGGAWATGKISISTRGGGSLRVGSDPGTSDGGASCFLDNDGTGYPLFVSNGNQSAATWATFVKTPGGAAFYTIGYDSSARIVQNYATAGGYGCIFKGRLAENEGTAKSALTANDWVADFDGPTHVYSGNTALNRIDFGATVTGGQKITIVFTHATPGAISGNTATSGTAKGIRLRAGATTRTPTSNDAITFVYCAATTFFHEV